MQEKELLAYINKYLYLLNKNFSVHTKKKIPYKDLHDIYTDLNNLFNEYFILNQVECSKLVLEKYINLLNTIIKLDNNPNYSNDYAFFIKNAYRMGARTSFEHYMIYREWEDAKEDKFFAPRYNAILGYIHYLEEIAKNPNFRLIIFNAMSGFGKTFPEKISEAWNFGYNSSETVLSLCSNEDVVKGGSRTVIDEIKSEWFGEVFPDLKYNENDKNFFLKETESNWKLRDCKLNSSYYAKTVQSNVVGVRASQRIHIDDLYADYKEAMSQSLNEYYLNKYLTVWKKRFVQNAIPKIVVTGTLWASGDFIALLIQLVKKQYTFHKHPKYKFTWVNEDETIAIIQIPALDYETGLSTCPELKTTKELLLEKSQMDEYLFQTNFQQIPTDPESLYFSYGRIRTYDTIPKTEYLGTYAVIDATRKSGKDFFAMPIFMKVPNENDFDYYLKDCIFTRTATKDMYEDICNKIIEHHIVKMVIESNVTSELKQNIDRILQQNGVNYCEIVEKYNSENKQARITDEKGMIVRKLVFPAKNRVGVNSDMGKFMDNLTLYNDGGRNPNDDACFEAGTLISTPFGKIPIEKIKVGMKVITPFGLRKVTECGITGYKETINKFGLNVTPNHKVFNKEVSKFKPIDTLTSFEEIDKLSLGELIKWKIKLLNLTEKHIKETPKADITLNTTPRTKIELANLNYIEQFGNTTMVKYLKDFKYTIKMVILIIMTLVIWSVYQFMNIYQIILRKIGKVKNIVSKWINIYFQIKKNKKKQNNGINQKKKENVNFATKNILQKYKDKNFVLQNANKSKITYLNLNNAKFVEKHFLQQVISQEHVQENVKVVYNLKVEDAGCYYANDILVSNCDSAALFTREIIGGRTQLAKIKPIFRPF